MVCCGAKDVDVDCGHVLAMTQNLLGSTQYYDADARLHSCRSRFPVVVDAVLCFEQSIFERCSSSFASVELVPRTVAET